MITIILADDHPVVRQGLRAFLETESDFQVVAEAGDGLQAVSLVAEMKPSVLVLDLMMPGLNGLDATRRIHELHPKTRVIILSMHTDQAYVQQALKNGATGYVLKGATATDLIQAIRDAATGREYISASLKKPALQTRRKNHEPEMPPEGSDSLSARERQVLRLTSQGLPKAEIAKRLRISPSAAEKAHLSLLAKMNLPRSSRPTT